MIRTEQELNEDRRYLAMRDRFRTLSFDELKRIIDNIDGVCFDTFNYDEQNRTFCPIAWAMDLPEQYRFSWQVNDDLIRESIEGRFKPVNILKGLPGKFYHGDTAERRKDLILIVFRVLMEKNVALLGKLKQLSTV